MPMSMRSQCLSVVVAGVLSVSGMAAAAPVLSVDFDSNSNNGNWSATQSGYVSFKTDGSGTVSPVSATYGTSAVTSGNIAVTLVTRASDGAFVLNADGDLTASKAGAMLVSRDRWKSTGVTISNSRDLYRDFVNCSSPIGIEIAGLDANTDYSFTFYTYDYTTARSTTYHLLNANGSALAQDGTVTGTISSVPGDNGANSYSLTLTATSNAAGKLFFDATGSALINGFDITTVPETATGLMLLGLSGIASLYRRR